MEINSCCFRTNKQAFISGSEDQTIKVWRIEMTDDEINLKVSHTAKAHTKVYAVFMSYDLQQLVESLNVAFARLELVVEMY